MKVLTSIWMASVRDCWISQIWQRDWKHDLTCFFCMCCHWEDAIHDDTCEHLLMVRYPYLQCELALGSYSGEWLCTKQTWSSIDWDTDNGIVSTSWCPLFNTRNVKLSIVRIIIRSEAVFHDTMNNSSYITETEEVRGLILAALWIALLLQVTSHHSVLPLR